MAEPLLMSPTTGFSPRSVNPTLSPRPPAAANFVPDQVIVTPRSYSATSLASPSSPRFSPLNHRSWSVLSPRIITSPRDHDINSTPRPYSAAASLNGPPSPFPLPGTPPPSPFPLALGPLPPNRLRWSTTSTAAAGSINTLEQKRKAAVSFAYIWPAQHRPAIQHDDFTDIEIPTVDLTSLRSKDPAARKQVVAQVRAACLDWGFFHAVNHGIPLQLLDRVQKQAQRLFALPKEDKLKVEREPKSYTGYGHAGVKPTDTQPWSEGFYLANDSTVDKFSQALWPRADNEDFG